MLGRYDPAGRLRLVVLTSPLPAAARREVGALLAPANAGHPWHGVRFSAGWGRGDLDFIPVQPELVAEFVADTAVDEGRWRHPVRFARIRDDTDVDALPLVDPGRA
ncbi:hypothetical protein AB0F30_29170 [Streptomyces sp. NPDC029006]|uniref:hypothetical protein n=1 Tax=Streptomyces sp. NPDC029006 TaxID=3155467 RepID=UPI0033F0007A